MLQNRVYRGEIVHKGAAYPGEHPAIVDEALWAKVQEKLEANGVERIARRKDARRACLLSGILFDADGAPMTLTHAIKKGVRYRYYVSWRLITEARTRSNRDPGVGQRLPAVDPATLVGSGYLWDVREAPVGAQLLPQLISAPYHYIWLLFVPAAIGLIAMGTARMTVLRVLGRMP